MAAAYFRPRTMPPTRLSRAPAARAHTAYTDPTGVFTVGVWACDAGTLEINDLAIDEACYLIAGEVIISDPQGNSERFVAGEAFLLERGLSVRGTCRVRFSNTMRCSSASGKASREGDVWGCDWRR